MNVQQLRGAKDINNRIEAYLAERLGESCELPPRNFRVLSWYLADACCPAEAVGIVVDYRRSGQLDDNFKSRYFSITHDQLKDI